MTKNLFSYIIFFALVINAIYLHSFNELADSIRLFGLNGYNAIALLFIPGAMLGYLLNFKKMLKDPNSFLLVSILIYSLYQILVILPLSFISYPELHYSLFLSPLTTRLSVLLIPLFYWFLIDETNLVIIDKSFSIISIIFLLLGVFSYSTGANYTTNTGSVRLLTITAVLYLFYTMVGSLKLFGAVKNSAILLIVSLGGIILSLFRSAYLSVFFVFILSLFISNRKSSSLQLKIKTVFLILLFLFMFTRISSVSEMFYERVEVTFNTDDANYNDRFIKNILAFETFLDNPINGTLLSGYYYKIANVKEDYNWAPHNFIFSFLASQGIIGISFILFFFLIPLFYYGFKVRFSVKGSQSFYVLAFYTIVSLANTTFFNPGSLVVLMITGATILHERTKLITTKSRFNKLTE